MISRVLQVGSLELPVLPVICAMRGVQHGSNLSQTVTNPVRGAVRYGLMLGFEIFILRLMLKRRGGDGMSVPNDQR